MRNIFYFMIVGCGQRDHCERARCDSLTPSLSQLRLQSQFWHLSWSLQHQGTPGGHPGIPWDCRNFGVCDALCYIGWFSWNICNLYGDFGEILPFVVVRLSARQGWIEHLLSKSLVFVSLRSVLRTVNTVCSLNLVNAKSPSYFVKGFWVMQISLRYTQI